MYLESDLNVASFLLARGFPLRGLELVGTRYAFKFDSSADGNPTLAVQDYHKGAVIPAREFAAAIQQLKTALYTAKFSKDGNGNERKYETYRR
jgi:hypothetical protein